MNRVKSNIAYYLPALIKIIGESDFDWPYIDTLFSKKLNEREKKANGDKTIEIEATIYDIIIEVKKGNKQAHRLLDFLQKLMEELSINLNDKEQKLIKKNLRDFLTTFDKGYLNFVGEIAVLNNLIKSGTYRLESVETQLLSNKKIDFKLKTISNDKHILVEVVNIHLNSERIKNEETQIQKFFTHRLTGKIESKESGTVDFFLIPVLWGAAEDIKIYSDYFMKNKMHLSNVLEPVSFMTYIDPDNHDCFSHKFGNVSNL